MTPLGRFLLCFLMGSFVGLADKEAPKPKPPDLPRPDANFKVVFSGPEFNTGDSFWPPHRQAKRIFEDIKPKLESVWQGHRQKLTEVVFILRCAGNDHGFDVLEIGLWSPSLPPKRVAAVIRITLHQQLSIRITEEFILTSLNAYLVDFNPEPPGGRGK
jgi:hypothetical protein